MPGRTLPVISLSELQAHTTKSSCYVTHGEKVFDITSFLEDHPGGGDLILEYAGRDVTEIMKDEISHTHSEAAYEVLDDHLVGFLEPNSSFVATKRATHNGDSQTLASLQDDSEIPQTGDVPSRVEPLRISGEVTDYPSIDTDATLDYRTHRFLDLNRPLLMQVWNGGFSKEFYLAQVHRPRHYKVGGSASLFGNFLEPLSKTPWWVIPTIWLPPVIYGTYLSRDGLSNWAQVACFWLVGLAIWTVVEYGLHRCLFHVDKLCSLSQLNDRILTKNRHMPDNRVAITLHFLLHGIHHYLPMDRLRLVMPPALFVVLAIPFWELAHVVFFWNWYAAVAAFSGGIFGYICYDVTHYSLHHRTLPAYYRKLKRYHLQHHFQDYQNGFGVTNRFWDRVFGTELALSAE
ncbi:MAG: fatty acid alpha-hydroxylase [Peltula sp. TS41687]|nr:MAG: fatty acid alpha-hydroxylase [Peltula sp. TS41687]